MKRTNIKNILVSLLLISALALSMGCSILPDTDSSPPSNSSSPSNTTAPINPDWTLPTTGEQDTPLPDFISLVAKIKPSVVVINTETITYNILNQPYSESGAGSGWIIDEDGYVVTNNHVVEDADNITVILDNGRAFPAGIVGSDPLTDVAVIKIEADNLVKADIGNSSELKVGEWVLAVGNSLNLGVTPSEGIIRSLEASIQMSAGEALYGLIGTSAAINPGNSGGPLVNMKGEVVGITTVKIATVEVEAMGWAISTDTALPIIEHLIQKGYVIRPYLGISFRTADQYTATSYGLSVDTGALIEEVLRGTPADKAGLKAGDVIVGVDEKEIATMQQLVQAIHSCNINQRIEITFWRGAVRRTTHATLIENPANTRP